jgi:hypothetical protein
METVMKRIILTAVAALLVTVPAAIGLIGNTSFAQSVPVRVPPRATVVDDTSAEHSAAEHGDDKGGQRSPSTTEPGDDKGGQRSPSTTEPGHDQAGHDQAGQRSPSTTQPGDDKGGLRAATPAGAGAATPRDTSSGKGQNGGHGGKANPSGGKDDGPGHP